MKAIVLCAGYGKRLYPYTETTQKTMLPLHGKPSLEYIMKGLIYGGIRDFIFVVGYQKEQIVDYFKEGEKWGVNIQYVEQIDLNGTGGALLLCESLIDYSHFILTWGDTILDHDVYANLVHLFEKERHDFILVTNYTLDPHLGAAVYTIGDFCVDIVEKPPKGKSKSKLNNAGLFLLSKDIFDTLKILKPSVRGEIELPQALANGIKHNKWNVRVLKMEPGQFKGDIGNKSEYEKLNNDDSWLNFLKFI